jgi:hypothetical protein
MLKAQLLGKGEKEKRRRGFSPFLPPLLFSSSSKTSPHTPKAG